MDQAWWETVGRREEYEAEQREYTALHVRDACVRELVLDAKQVSEQEFPGLQEVWWRWYYGM